MPDGWSGASQRVALQSKWPLFVLYISGGIGLGAETLCQGQDAVESPPQTFLTALPPKSCKGVHREGSLGAAAFIS